MTYQVLARKWRPQTFEEVVGQPFVVKTLQNALKSQRLGQAYLFCGPRGVGKTTVARILAKALNCKNGPPETPCNACASCREISQGISPDVQEIDGASNRGIDEIRNLRENVKYLPTLGQKRVYIIDEVHMLTIHAFNALLKTLEEPPRHVVFIFATTEPHKVPPTILSRCQRFDFKRITPKDMAQHIRLVAEKEGVRIDGPALDLIVQRSEGSMRDAQSLLDQLIAFVGTEIRYEDVAELMGEIESALITDTCLAIVERDPKTIFKSIKTAFEKGYDLKEFYRRIMEIFKDALFFASGADLRELGMPLWREELVERVYRSISPETLGLILGLMLRYYELLRGTEDLRIIIEIVLIRLSMRAELMPISKLLDTLTDLGSKKKASILEAYETQFLTQGSPRTDVASIESTPEKDWEGFMEFLKRQRSMMAMSLSNWQLDYLGTGEVSLIPPEHSVLKDYLKDSQRMSELTGFLRQYFGREMRVVIKEREGQTQKKVRAIEELMSRFKAEIVPNGTIPTE